MGPARSFLERRHHTALRTLARRLRRQERVQLLQQERHRLRRALAQERAQLLALQGQLAEARRTAQEAAQQAQRARLAQLYWQPVAVARAQGVVTTQAPLDVSLGV